MNTNKLKPDFEKGNGLVPVIIQNGITLQVLMLGYMNSEAFEKSIEEKKVTFYSRSKNRLWTKGEESGNFLNVDEIKIDCDNDTILISVTPEGPTCHTGDASCFGKQNTKGYIYQLQQTIQSRIKTGDENSYTNSLFKKGINKIAQKVGEEAVELIIEAKDNNENLFINEAADLLFHYLLLINAKGFDFEKIEEELIKRSKV